MSLQARGSEIRHDLVDIASRRQVARDHWSGHAQALHRIGLIDEEELREMLEYADAVYVHVAEDLAYLSRLKIGDSEQGESVT